ncbi:hypothetical protein G6F68_016385 [Rhizopus microsporus]|nr:hypothetical protein G6F68_016385 [Rhizopus microsporus]
MQVTPPQRDGTQRSCRPVEQLRQQRAITADARGQLHHGRALPFEHARQPRQQHRVASLQMLLEALAGGEGHEFVQRTGAVKRADVTAARGGMQFKQQHAIELELGMLTKRRIALPRPTRRAHRQENVR